MAYKDKEKEKAHYKAYREANKEKVDAYQRAYAEAHREQKRIAANVHYHTHKEMHRDSRLRRKYGISLDAYNDMYAAVNGCCQICGKHANELHVDHDHITDKVRGLLCESCNRGLGFFWDDQALLKQAVEYLDKTK